MRIILGGAHQHAYEARLLRPCRQWLGRAAEQREDRHALSA